MQDDHPQRSATHISIDGNQIARLARFLGECPGRLSEVLLNGSLVGDRLLHDLQRQVVNIPFETPPVLSDVTTLVAVARRFSPSPGGILVLRFDGGSNVPGGMSEEELIDYFEIINLHREVFADGHCRTLFLLTPDVSNTFNRVADDLRSWIRVFDMTSDKFIVKATPSTQESIQRDFAQTSASHGAIEVLKEQYERAKESGLPFNLLVYDYFGPLVYTTLSKGQSDLIAYVSTELENLIAKGQGLLKETVSSPRVLSSMQILHTFQGDLCLRLGDSGGAREHYETALEIARDLVRRDPDNTEWQRELSVSWDNIGVLRLRLGDGDGAWQAFEASLKIAKDLARTDPDNTEWQRDLSVSWSHIGDLRLRLGDEDGARQAYDASLQIRQDLARRDPDNTQWQHDLSMSWNKIGDLRLQLDDDDGARQAFEAGLDIVENLVRRDPDNTEWQRDLWVSWNKIGDLRRRFGDGDGAREAFEVGLDIIKNLVRRDPDNTEWQRDLAITYVKLAQLADATGAHDDALLHWITASNALIRIHERTPEVPQAAWDVAHSALDLANCLTKLGRVEEALSHQQRAATVARQLRERGHQLSPRLNQLLEQPDQQQGASTE